MRYQQYAASLYYISHRVNWPLSDGFFGFENWFVHSVFGKVLLAITLSFNSLLLTNLVGEL